MLAMDIGIVTSTMTALKASPDLIAQINQLLTENSDGLGNAIVTEVQPSWWGKANSAHRIAVNTNMAHEAVVEEFQKLADSLREYSAAITEWGEKVNGIDATTADEMRIRNGHIANVNSTIIEAQSTSTDSTMGDGIYGATNDGGA